MTLQVGRAEFNTQTTMPMVKGWPNFKDSVSLFGDGMQFMAWTADVVNYRETNNIKKYIFVQALLILE